MSTERIQIGQSNLIVSRLGFGCCPLGGHGWGKVDQEKAKAAIQRALELGINFFDTADVYGFGNSESILGQTLKEVLGSKRDQALVTTKFGVRWDESGKITKDTSPQYLREAVESSLKRLQLDAIPLYQIHWPDTETPIEATLLELEKLQAEGKIQAIGVSNFSKELVSKAQAITRLDSHQFEYSLAKRDVESSLLPQAQDHQMSVMTWGSLAQGLFSGKYDINTRFQNDDRRHRYENFKGERFKGNLEIVDRIKAIAGLYNKLPAQVALRWLLDTPGVSVTLTGIKTPEQIEQNSGALGWKLKPEHYAFLSEPSLTLKVNLKGETQSLS